MFLDAWANYDKRTGIFGRRVKIAAHAVVTVRENPDNADTTVITAPGAQNQFGNIFYLDMPLEAACQLIEEVCRNGTAKVKDKG